MIPTLDEFLTWTWPKNSYVEYPGFKTLYVRHSPMWVSFDNMSTQKCVQLVQIGNLEAEQPGNRAFTRLVEDLIGRGYAVFVECVHVPRFRMGLLKMGFTPVNTTQGHHYLKNFEGHLEQTP